MTSRSSASRLASNARSAVLIAFIRAWRSAPQLREQRLDTERAAAGVEIGDEGALTQSPCAAEKVAIRTSRTRSIGLLSRAWCHPDGRAGVRRALQPPRASPARLRGDRRRAGARLSAVIRPSPQIVCVDCGGRCFLLTAEPEDGLWEERRDRRLPLRGLPRPMGHRAHRGRRRRSRPRRRPRPLTAPPAGSPRPIDVCDKISETRVRSHFPIANVDLRGVSS